MTLTQLAPPYPIFTDKSGSPLDKGYLYFGTVNLNPETNPIAVYYDSALTQPAAQPLRTSNGYVMRNGSPAIIYANSYFSVTVRDKNKAMVIYSPSGYGIIPGTSATSTDQMTYNQGGTGAVSRVLTSRLQDYISVKDFGAVGNGITNDTVAIQTAINYAASSKTGRVYFPKGHYIVTTLYDHYDAVTNPGFPNGNYLAGRITLEGAQAISLPDLRAATGSYRGTLIETISATGPALLLGNGVSATAATARRQVVKNMSFQGTCTGSVVELDAAQQAVTLEHLSIYNKNGANGIGLYVHNGSYLDKFSDIDITSSGTNGIGIKLDSGSANVYERINVSGCGGTGWDITIGTGNNFFSCQSSGNLNGMVMNGGLNNTLQGWWFEQNTGDFDLKIRNGAANVTLQGVLFTSTTLDIAGLILGDNTGTTAVDSCRNVQVNQCAFNFCGPTSAVGGVKKFGTCTVATFNNCSFKNNGGRAFIIDTTNGVTPTSLTYPDFFPADASSAIGDASKLVNQSGTQASYLARGLGISQTLTPVVSTSVTGAANNGSGLIRITSVAHGLSTGDYVNISGVTGTTEANGNWDVTVISADTFDLVSSTFTNAYVSGGTVQKFVLDMRTWKHIPDQLFVTTSRNGFIAMPTNAPDMLNKMFSVRKNLAGNSLTVVAGSIDGSTSVSITANQGCITLLATQPNTYARLL